MSTGIDYLDEVWNPVTGCSGKGCKVRDHCWAQEMVRRFPNLHEGKGFDLERGDNPLPFPIVHFHPDRLDKPLHWRKPRRIGVCYMGDLFDEQVPWRWVYDVYEKMASCPRHAFFVLTKQPVCLVGFIKYYKAWRWKGNDRLIDQAFSTDFARVWHGVSVTDQEDADRMLPELLQVPGQKWLSIEPMLGPINLVGFFPFSPVGLIPKNQYVDWIVLGCESGPKRRPCPHEWMIDVVNQCKAAGVPVWVKQVEVNGKVSHNPAEWPEELRVREKEDEKSRREEGQTG